MSAEANTAIDILQRALGEQPASLSAEAAHTFLRFRFPPADIQRMNELAEKARAGALTPDEAVEIDHYEFVGHFMSVLKSKARQRLASSGN
jgi:hypothetical protein